jgi:two-component system response regulator AtoC
MPVPIDELSGLDVLVVDDDPAIRELLVEHLRERGLRAATAQDGRAAVAALERSAGRFVLVLTDINMPGADGFAVLQAAKAANASTYVVIITGFASLDTAIRAVRSGAQDYLTKPFSLGQIDIILQKIADRFALERENRQLAQRGGSTFEIESRLDAIERTLLRIEALLATERVNSRIG